MKLDISTVNFSRFDNIRSIHLPTKMTTELAEDIGVMIGDGNIGLYRRGTTTDYVVGCTGNLVDEKRYYKEHLRNLKLKLFGANFGYYEKISDSTCYLKLNSKCLLEFYTKVIGLPIGRKTNIKIPNKIFSNKQFIAACMRGLGDTDMSLSFKRRWKKEKFYPVIKLSTCSKPLVNSINEALCLLGFSPSICLDIKKYDIRYAKGFISHEIALYGKLAIDKWFNIIGSNNPKTMYKYDFWKRFDVAPSQSKIYEILNKQT